MLFFFSDVLGSTAFAPVKLDISGNIKVSIWNFCLFVCFRVLIKINSFQLTLINVYLLALRLSNWLKTSSNVIHPIRANIGLLLQPIRSKTKDLVYSRFPALGNGYIFSRAWHGLHAVTLISDWLVVLFAYLLLASCIICSDWSDVTTLFCFMTVIRNY